MRYSLAYAVTPHDSNPSIRIGDVADALYIGGTGTLRVLMADGKQADFTAVPVGIFPIAVTKIFASGTTVTNVLALKI